jgi:hypothetical protein
MECQDIGHQSRNPAFNPLGLIILTVELNGTSLFFPPVSVCLYSYAASHLEVVTNTVVSTTHSFLWLLNERHLIILAN